MPETFLILLAGGVMLAAAVSDPRAVTLHWLRLGGILALCMGGLGAFFYVQRGPAPDVPALYRRVQVGLVVATIVCVLGQLAFVQVERRGAQRGLAGGGVVGGGGGGGGPRRPGVGGAGGGGGGFVPGGWGVGPPPAWVRG